MRQISNILLIVSCMSFFVFSRETMVDYPDYRTIGIGVVVFVVSSTLMIMSAIAEKRKRK